VPDNPHQEKSAMALEIGDLQWRAAVLAVHTAQSHYLELMKAVDANERDVDLAWLALWKAEQRRDDILCGATAR
jgi:hypothetical protein